MTLPATAPPVPTPLLSPRYRWATVGMVSLIFLAAFEALAVTTIMPTVSADLDGRAWFSAAFSVTLAASVVGMVAGGMWSDRSGPKLPLLASVAIFALGLLLAGLSPSIQLFVAARFLQGLGTGAMTVALYVLVARIYDPVDHPAIFGAFAAAWVIPSMVGPTVAGVVAEASSWRWVFLGWWRCRSRRRRRCCPRCAAWSTGPSPQRGAGARGRLALSAVVAVAVVALDLAGRARGSLGYVAAAVSLVVVLVAVRPLLPAGTLAVRRGLPAVVALRARDRGDVLRHRDLPAVPAPGALRRARLAVRRDPDRRGARLGRGVAGAGPARCAAGARHRAPDRRGPALRRHRRGAGGASLHLTPWLVGAAWVLSGRRDGA